MSIETVLQARREHVVTSLRIEVVDGPDRGKHAIAADAELAVGTARDNQLVLADFTVSRYHLEAAVRSGGIALHDLGSTNGTYVGAVRIERALLPPGTLVKLGGTTVRFDDAVRTTVPAPPPASFAGMVASAPQMLKLFGDLERVAPAATSVLIVGESGTGKEKVAEAVHARSGRSGPLVTIDCGALPSNLLASELFGHERGAFTGADRTHVGAFERAGTGTVFLDEIGELPPADQVALLGVLERRRFRRVGGTTELELGARVVAATNRDLRAEVNNGRFRHDLYHRLAVVVLRLPPLRERAEDIPLLVAHFARELGIEGASADVFGDELLARWQRHPWPGNIRELRNAVEAASIVGPGGPEPIAAGAGPAASEGLAPYKEARAAHVAAFEHAYLSRLLLEAQGNVSKAARLARMDRSHLIDLLHRHGLKA
ncbi:MAG TPA: sigma 54-interacting transcriptional regulator [Kofleriaceae bacterium]|nr:sigma 54-interacting transcriptional regulator [Kofleriaceae bacterium]